MERNTRQRKAIQRAFEEADRPLTPDEALAGARGAAPGLGIATVYRALKGLTDEGWLKTVELPGEPPRYEIAGKPHHHHFHCRKCGRAFEVEGCPGVVNAKMPKGFVVEDHEVVLYGVCAECAGDGRAKGEGRSAKGEERRAKKKK